MITESIATATPLSELVEQASHFELPGVYNDIREQAAMRYRELGIPGRKHEEWKYLDTSFLTKNTYTLAEENTSEVDYNAFGALRLTGDNTLLFITENGFLKPAGAFILPHGVHVGRLSELSEDAEVMRHFAQYAPAADEHFVALNTATVQDPMVILIADNTRVEELLEIVHLSGAANTSVAVNQRLLVVVGKGSSVNFTERYRSINGAKPYFANAVTETIIGENAAVQHILIQEESDAASRIHYHEVIQSRDSRHFITTFSFGGSNVRSNLHIRLEGENCESHLNGLTLATDNRSVDHHTLVDHKVPHCYSNELYKFLLGGKSQGVFNGKVFVRPDAQKTNAYQSNKCILLSDDASMNAKPQLEIYADDVKCSHGATTGQMDEEALFYLRARGIGEQKARILLNNAFAADVVNTIPMEEVKDSLLALLDEQLVKLEA